MRRLIKTDGTLIDLPDPLTSEQVSEMIGAGSLGWVNLRHMGEPLHVMLIDDLGYRTELKDHGGGHFELVCVEALKPANLEATKLYHANCIPGTTHQIVGDVIVQPDSDYASEGVES